jgi:hypothetical protein
MDGQAGTEEAGRGGESYFEPRCHEGNYGLPALLLGERVAEKAFAEGGPDPATRCIINACGGSGPSGGFADEGEDANPLQ